MSTTIYISTYDQPVIHLSCSVPVEVGAALRNSFLYEVKDDTGDSISKENPYYGELTGLYWVWRNTEHNPGDVIGFCHYNKGIDISISKAEKLVGANKWIVLRKCKNGSHPLQNELDTTVGILQCDYPEYYRAWMEIYNKDGSGSQCIPAQCFITSYEEFCKYCEFLFEFLPRLREEIGEGDKSPNLKRYCAFAGERLLAVYLKANHIEIEEYGIKYRSFVKTIAGRIRDFMHINKDTSLYKHFQRKYGMKSSYKY